MSAVLWFEIKAPLKGVILEKKIVHVKRIAYSEAIYNLSAMKTMFILITAFHIIF